MDLNQEKCQRLEGAKGGKVKMKVKMMYFEMYRFGTLSSGSQGSLTFLFFGLVLALCVV